MTRDKIAHGMFIRGIEDTIDQAAHVMEQARLAQDLPQSHRAAKAWRMAQELWLQAAQGMTHQEAHTIMIRFATDDSLLQWQEQRAPGPPPSIRERYRT